MAEMSPWMNVAGTEQSHQGMLCWQDVVYTEVCDPATHAARAVRPARHAGLHAPRAHQPADDPAGVRRSHAVGRTSPIPCGRTYPRLPQGIFGRIDDMFTIRGENIYPSEIDAALNQLPNYGGEHRIVITRDAAMDELLLRVEADEADASRRRRQRRGVPRRGRAQAADGAGHSHAVEIVAPHSIPRTDFKARRVIDDREVFRGLNEQLRSAKGADGLRPIAPTLLARAGRRRHARRRRG